MFGALLVLLVIALAATSGFGDDDPGDVAVVDGDQITQEDFDKALGQAAARQGAATNCQAPGSDDPQYATLRDEAMNDVLDSAWILGEADERGVEASDREIQDALEQTKSQNFGSDKEYQAFLTQSCFTQEDVDLRVKLQVLSTKIQEKITADVPPVEESDIQDYYDANKEQFTQPVQRDIRLILNQDPEKAQQAADQLKQDNSDQNWNKVAAQYSTDAISKDKGGVRESVTEGVFPEAVDAQIFDAPEGEVIGPIETDSGTYVFQVDSATEATAAPLDDVRAQIEQQLNGQAQQEAFGEFLTDYRDRWAQVTVCADDFVTERCDNFSGEVAPCPDPSLPQAQQDQQLQAGCPPPVISRNPVAPGTVLPFVSASGQPQRPHPPGEDVVAPAGLPAGTAPGGVPVQPGATPGG